MTNLQMGKHLSSSYSMAIPYPHIIFDNFISEDIAKQCYNSMNSFTEWGFDPMFGYPEDERNSQVNKFFTPWDDENSISNIKSAMPVVWKTLQYLNSPTFLSFLSKLTGINDLIVDPTFYGGGCHKILKGGRLEVHSDYNKHPKTELYRRINLLLYLTPNWQEEWGGHLELWKNEPLTKVKSILPVFNRAVIFNTTDVALHGHPEMLNTPDDINRYSLALYYFTKDRPEHEKSNSESAVWYKTL